MSSADIQIDKLYDDLKILTEINRLTIIKYLKNRKSASVGQIADQLKVSFKATSKHLLILSQSGILERAYDGPFVMYRLSSNIPKLFSNIVETI